MRLTDEIKRVKLLRETIRQNQHQLTTIHSDLLDFFDKLIEILEREIFSREELYTIWLALLQQSSTQQTNNLADRVHELAKLRAREGL